MLKVFFKKLGFGEKAEETELGFEFDEEEVKKSFSESVAETHIAYLSEAIKDEMCRLCHTDEKIKATWDAIAYCRRVDSGERLDECRQLIDAYHIARIKNMFPGLIFTSSLGGYVISTKIFNINDFCKNLAKEAIESSGFGSER